MSSRLGCKTPECELYNLEAELYCKECCERNRLEYLKKARSLAECEVPSCRWSAKKETQLRQNEQRIIRVADDSKYPEILECCVESCGKYICSTCYQSDVGEECKGCRAFVCDECTSYCRNKRCKGALCPSCSFSCSNCSKTLCEMCSADSNCNVCKRKEKNPEWESTKEVFCERCMHIYAQGNGNVQKCRHCTMRVCKRYCRVVCIQCEKSFCRCRFKPFSVTCISCSGSSPPVTVI